MQANEYRLRPALRLPFDRSGVDTEAAADVGDYLLRFRDKTNARIRAADGWNKVGQAQNAAAIVILRLLCVYPIESVPN